MSMMLSSHQSQVQLSYEDMVGRLQGEGKQIVYPHQKQMANDIVDSFFNDGVLLVTLIAPPQWGKTGVVMEVAYSMTTYADSAYAINPSHVFFITGMSDLCWKHQTRDRVLHVFRENVFHRNNIKQLVGKLQGKRDCLVILDECHIATEAKQKFAKEFHDSGIMDVNVMKNNNIRVLQTSATPVHALVDASEWGALHKTCIAVCPNEYVGFDTLLAQNRVHHVFDLGHEDAVAELMKRIMATWRRPKYHIMRLNVRKSAQEANCLSRVGCAYGFDVFHHNAKTRLHNIDALLGQSPTKHTIIMIKGFWRAAKTFSDLHIGICHETSGKSKDFNAEVQGLAGRLCGYKPYYHKDDYPPVICCNRSILEEYIAWFCKRCDYRTVRYRCATLRACNGNVRTSISMLHPQNVSNMPDDVTVSALVRYNPIDTHGYSYRDYHKTEFLVMLGLTIFPTTPDGLCSVIRTRLQILTNVVYVGDTGSEGYYCILPRMSHHYDVYCFKHTVRVMVKM
jgi:hypothetical protein